jgi:hypothetical protein
MVVAADPASGSVIPMQKSSPAAAWGSQAPPHGLVPQVLDGPGGTVEDQLAEDGGGDVDPGDLLEDDGGLDVAHPHPAELLGHRHREEVGPSQGLEGRFGELLGLVPARRVGGDVALGHVAGQLPQSGPVLALVSSVEPADALMAGSLPVAGGRRT